jgi:hypothetical protein
MLTIEIKADHRVVASAEMVSMVDPEGIKVRFLWRDDAEGGLRAMTGEVIVALERECQPAFAVAARVSAAILEQMSDWMEGKK